MILSLHIKNIALIRELDLELSKGLNVLSGETGAGKSIIIDSLNFVLGDRADKSLIRHGEKSASVQVVFDGNVNTETASALSDAGIPEDDVIIVSRTMSETGRNECRVNGSLVNLSALKNIVTLLVDIHSQHEHQALLNENNHIRILDNYNKEIGEQKARYSDIYRQYKDAVAELNGCLPEDERARKADILKFQLEEITKANVKDGEEEELIAVRAKFYNSQKITDLLSGAIAFIQGGDGDGAIPSVHNAAKNVNNAVPYISALNQISERLESVKIELDDIADTLKAELEGCSYDAYEMEKIEKRIEEIRKIKKRFGKTEEERSAFYQKTEAEYLKLSTMGERMEELTSIITRLTKELVLICKKLHGLRLAASNSFGAAIVKNLADLGMIHSTFQAEILMPESDGEILASAGPDGADSVRFLISPNKGEPLKPLAKIASGGEMSRFMLGLKNITAELEDIDTLVFDEIDTGISGKIAKVVACKLYDIARLRQVIAVTHLPQLASMADTHYLISKREVDDKTLTFVNKLTTELSIKEIMRLTGSGENSESGYLNAMELKTAAENYKKTGKIA